MPDFEFDVREIPLTPPIGVLIDTGVNRGQFARVALPHFRPAIYRGFEPLPAACWAANKAISDLDPNSDDWVVIECGLGDQWDNAAVMRLDTHEPSSSLLEIGPDAPRYGIPMRQAESLRVGMDTVDGWCHFEGIEQIDLLKIDVQGYEGRVLRGAREMLKRAKFVVVEVLFCQHYIGQSSPEEIDQLLREGGLKFIKWLRRHPQCTRCQGAGKTMRHLETIPVPCAWCGGGHAPPELEGDALYGRAE